MGRRSGRQGLAFGILLIQAQIGAAHEEVPMRDAVIVLERETRLNLRVFRAACSERAI